MAQPDKNKLIGIQLSLWLKFVLACIDLKISLSINI